MADLTIALKTQIANIFGPTPSTKWNEFKWTAVGVGPGNGTWGIKSAGSLGTTAIQKTFFYRVTWSGTNDAAATSTVSKYAVYLRTWTGSNSAVFTDGFVPAAYLQVTWSKTNNAVVTGVNSDLELGTGNGYYYVFPGGSSNFTSAASATYSS